MQIGRRELGVRLVRQEERAHWRELMKRHHYLGFASIIGESLWYVASVGKEWVALLGWGSEREVKTRALSERDEGAMLRGRREFRNVLKHGGVKHQRNQPGGPNGIRTRVPTSPRAFASESRSCGVLSQRVSGGDRNPATVAVPNARSAVRSPTLMRRSGNGGTTPWPRDPLLVARRLEPASP